jgi:hypothetical protein
MIFPEYDLVQEIVDELRKNDYCWEKCSLSQQDQLIDYRPDIVIEKCWKACSVHQQALLIDALPVAVVLHQWLHLLTHQRK